MLHCSLFVISLHLVPTERGAAENRMDSKGVRSLAIISYLMVFGMLLGQSTASFQSCYESCFLLCIITPHNSVGSCSFKCLKDCIIPTSYTTNKDNQQQYFCKLGCASSLCSSFSTKQNPEVEKVGGCLDSCSETCSTKNT